MLFPEIPNFTFFAHLQFEDEKTFKRCQKRAARSRLESRQKWLGSYYCKEIRQGFIPDVSIVWIDDQLGYGVFANRSFPRSSFIGEYTGLVCKQRLFRKIKNHYVFDYSFRSGTSHSPYLIDAEKQGNHTRFINHSDTPNLETASVLCDGVMHIILYAIEEIPAGAQLCYDYGEEYWKKREKPLRIAPRTG